MRRILGIDPGSRVTGYGVIDSDGRHSVHVASGCVRMKAEPFPERLGMIYRQLSELIDDHRPAEFAIEQVFMARNAASALKLGQARGAAICAGVNGGLEVHEYSPRSVKQALVGRGGADKGQVQHMVKVILSLSEDLAEDQSDALAVAICHAHTVQFATAADVRGGWRR
ncbi:MAG TPA: crossover junction endodeoxyribonuclease RuvC [Kiloniellaceae bacterium]|nr:crossover junction endodeoxyribonuclease RuvC [Kiloniellaceae bacterium]